MQHRFALHLFLAAACTAAAVGCAKSPVEPAGSATVTVGASSSPANGAQIPNAQQPVTLTITNGKVSTSDAVTYKFEVATDAGFASTVISQSVAQGTGATTSLTLGTLSPATTYYWRTRMIAGSTTGSPSTASQFAIGPAVTIQAPTPVSPLSGAGTTVERPALTVRNATRTGPATSISYRFEISTTSAFAVIFTSGTVAEQATSTTFTPSVDLASNTTYYWRASATDAGSQVTSAYSTAQQFKTQVSINLATVNYQRFYSGVQFWPITDTIISVDQDGGASDGYMCINHTKRNQWPTSDFLGDPEVPIEANQWYFAFINNQWYAGAGEYLRPNQICKSGQRSEDIGPDGTWAGPMDTWRPQAGELVGYMISTPARAWPDMKTIDQRSNIVTQPWVDSRTSSSSASSVKR